MNWNKGEINILKLIRKYHTQQQIIKYRKINESINIYWNEQIFETIWQNFNNGSIMLISNDKQTQIIYNMAVRFVLRRNQKTPYKCREHYLYNNCICKFCYKKFKQKSYIKTHLKMNYCSTIKIFEFQNGLLFS